MTRITLLLVVIVSLAPLGKASAGILLPGMQAPGSIERDANGIPRIVDRLVGEEHVRQ